MRSIVFAVLCIAAASIPVHGATVDISMQSLSFSPSSVTINVGDTVRWTNSQGTHTTTSGSNCTADGQWNSGLLSQGQTYSVTFNTPGTYSYFCIPHCSAGMTGTVIVSQSSALLTVSKSGTGSLTVTSSPAGIDCGTDCTETYTLDTAVILTATADSGTTFTGWSGACENNSTTCNVTMSADTSVTAHYLISDTSSFGDVSTGSVYWPYIEAIYNNSITVGCGSGNYCPSSSVTRGQMAAFITRSLYGEDFSYTLEPYFSDVPETNGYFKYVQKLKDAGITTVTGTYLVDSEVTRGQMAAFIVRSLYGEDFSYTLEPYFSDVPSDHNFFKYVQKLKDVAITVVTGTYGVDTVVTREQMAAFLARGFLGMQ
ncbi:MAG: S-layer homology domain-containing protein [Alphaproteobacteria bacterium]|uniref:S-layer homology domain-containing protein n=1 Tax=Candidatus Nitrobium versatile TaxID=2884831 RepID=A0A953JAT4_9BACT|nr:S-layer homology domain-containing protein [Candidatus Nitrobium versatile]